MHHPHLRDFFTATFTVIIGANLSEERFFPEPLSKDFIFVFPGMVLSSGREYKLHYHLSWIVQYHSGKNQTKVLGREFEGEPFFKRVSLNKSSRSQYKNHTYGRCCNIICWEVMGCEGTYRGRQQIR